MEVYTSLEQFRAPPGGAVLSIGNFDGVHRGHALLIETACEVAARQSAEVVAMTFDPHPMSVIAPERTPLPLTMTAEKLSLLERLGVHRCILLRSEPSLFQTHADDFLASVVAHCHPRAFVEGPDFNFGRGRDGDIDTLRRHAAAWGYEVHDLPAVHCEELPHRPRVSSSSIRQALLDGRVIEANAMLGRAYRIVGTTGYGEGRGAGLGFPTANVSEVPHLLPQEAVYGAVAQLASGELYLAAVNVGPQPTFAGEECRVEVFLIDFEGDLRGKRLGVHFLRRLREQSRFASAEALVEQIRRDVAEAGYAHATLDAMRQAPSIAL